MMAPGILVNKQRPCVRWLDHINREKMLRTDLGAVGNYIFFLLSFQKGKKKNNGVAS